MNEKNRKFFDEFKNSIRLCKWECGQDILDAIYEINERCYIIYINLWGMTCISDMYYYFHLLASQEFGKCLLIPKKKYDKLRRYIKKLYRLGEREEVYQMRDELNRLYPDFKF